ERHPLITHGLTMGVAGGDPFDPAYMEPLRDFCDRFEGEWHSDHLCFAGHEGARLHDLLPVPFTRATARRVAERIQEAQALLGRPMVVENISQYIHRGASEMNEAEFLREVVEHADCGLLLDVNDVFVNAQNFGFDPYAWLETIPLERVRQLHVAGHERWDRFDMFVDTHGATVLDEVHEMMMWVIARRGPLPVLLERDTNIPPLAELLDEVER